MHTAATPVKANAFSPDLYGDEAAEALNRYLRYWGSRAGGGGRTPRDLDDAAAEEPPKVPPLSRGPRPAPEAQRHEEQQRRMGVRGRFGEVSQFMAAATSPGSTASFQSPVNYRFERVADFHGEFMARYDSSSPPKSVLNMNVEEIATLKCGAEQLELARKQLAEANMRDCSPPKFRLRMQQRKELEEEHKQEIEPAERPSTAALYANALDDMTVLALATQAYEADSQRRKSSRRVNKGAAGNDSIWASHRQALMEARATLFALAKLSQSAEHVRDGADDPKFQAGDLIAAVLQGALNEVAMCVAYGVPVETTFDQSQLVVIAGMEYLHTERLLHEDDVSRKPDCVRLLLSVDKQELRNRHPTTPALAQPPEPPYSRGWLGRVTAGAESVLAKLAAFVRRLPCAFGRRGSGIAWRTRQGRKRSGSISITRRSDSLDEAFPPVLAKPQNYLDIISFLASHGADINTTDSKDGWGLVHLCCLRNNAKFLEHLLQNHGADPNLLSRSFETPLIIAAAENAVYCIIVLLYYSADIHLSNPSTGTTPLHAAASHGAIAALKLLLQCGARNDIEDMDGKLPSDVATDSWVRQLIMLYNSSPSEPPLDEVLSQLENSLSSARSFRGTGGVSSSSSSPEHRSLHRTPSNDPIMDDASDIDGHDLPTTVLEF